MTSPNQQSAENLVGEVQSEAVPLGLQWQIQTATVIAGSSAAAFKVQLTGDQSSKSVIAFSMVGPVRAGERVYVLVVPPAGLYVVGRMSVEGSEIETGGESVAFTTLTSFTVAVTFSRAFTALPNVHTNIDSGAAPTSQWHSRAISISTTGFTLFLFGPSATWTGYLVQWTAIAP